MLACRLRLHFLFVPARGYIAVQIFRQLRMQGSGTFLDYYPQRLDYFFDNLDICGVGGATS
jgi:hypothetical protein